jgi:hypothetical protein
MQSKESDLRQRTKEFALQIVWMFSGLPKTTEAQVLGKRALRSAHQSEQTTAKHIARVVNPSSSPNAATHCGN